MEDAARSRGVYSELAKDIRAKSKTGRLRDRFEEQISLATIRVTAKELVAIDGFPLFHHEISGLDAADVAQRDEAIVGDRLLA